MSSPVGANLVVHPQPAVLELDHRHAHVHEHVQQALQLVERPDLARNHGGHRGGLAAVRCQRERPPVRVPALGVRRLGRLGPERLLHGDHVGVREGVARGERGEVARPGHGAGRERGGGSRKPRRDASGRASRRGAHSSSAASHRIDFRAEETLPRRVSAPRRPGLSRAGSRAPRRTRRERWRPSWSDVRREGGVSMPPSLELPRRRFDVDFIKKTPWATPGRQLACGVCAFLCFPRNARQSSSVSRAPTREP